MRALTTCNAPASAIAEHAKTTGHTINWTDMNILTTNSQQHQRDTVEAWDIRLQSNPVNRNQGLLSHPYDSLYYNPNHHQYVHAYFYKYMRVYIF